MNLLEGFYDIYKLHKIRDFHLPKIINTEWWKEKPNISEENMRIGDRIAFRQSETWQKFRHEVAERQGNKDYVTGLPLTDDWNCHHLCVDQEK